MESSSSADGARGGKLGGAFRRARREHTFFLGVLAAVVVGAVIRVTYVLSHRHIGGDGFLYHWEAQRWAGGDWYTSAFGDVGAQYAHHPPGWPTLLAFVTKLGGHSMLSHQLVTVAVGLGVVAIAGLVGRSYFSSRVGVLAAAIAAVYPGFWVLEGNIWSEPLTLLVLGVFLLALKRLWIRPTVARAAVVGASCGVMALVRAEQLALFVLTVVPVLLYCRQVSTGGRLVRVGAAVLTVTVVIAPWALYNETRFEDHVLLSTSSGVVLLAGNCDGTYGGALLGYYTPRCGQAVAAKHRGADRSELDGIDRAQALANIGENIHRLPVTVLARFGRTLAVFRPSQTVDLVAGVMNSSTAPMWAWVVSFWALLPFVVLGALHARRERRFILPLVAPFLLVAVVVAVASGEPRFHASADLSAVILAAAGIDSLVCRRRRRHLRGPGSRGGHPNAAMSCRASN